MVEEPLKEGCYLPPEQLRIGVYVILDLPWFNHPFTLNNFRISSIEQLRELRALKLKRYRYDPERTTPPPPGWKAAEGTAAETEVPAEPVDGSSAEDEAAELTPAMAQKKQHAEMMRVQRERLAQVEKAFSKASTVMRNLNRNLFSRPGETLSDMGALVQQMIAVFLESNEATLHLMGERVGGEDVYYHSLNVTILAMMLAKHLGFSAEDARNLGVGTMLHDVGKVDIQDNVLNKSPEEYNNAELALYRMHVDYGVEIARKLGLSADVIRIIGQHHEFCDGSGYPRGTSEAVLSPGARLVSMVNFYDRLCNPVDISRAMTPHAALSFMFAKRSTKFEKAALQLLIRNLGVYPPGSFVQLSNEAIAVVISVNLKKPLRPWVRVYDEHVPKEEALMMDLDVAPEINISKGIPPGQLPPKVVAYLNPRKHVTYFFDAEQGMAHH